MGKKKAKKKSRGFEIETWSLKDIVPYPENAKTHNVDRIAASIKEFMPDQPIVVDGDGMIIKGHGRLEAAQALDMKTFPVIVRTDLSPEQIRLARLADNRSSEAPWDAEKARAEVKDIDLSDMDVGLDDLGLSDAWLKSLDGPDEDGANPKGGRPIRVTDEQRVVINQGIARVRLEADDPEMKEGRACELMAADFLAGAVEG